MDNLKKYDVIIADYGLEPRKFYVIATGDRYVICRNHKWLPSTMATVEHARILAVLGNQPPTPIRKFLNAIFPSFFHPVPDAF